ncbi:SWIM-type domain-containing protein [Aphis craccivora]|uniref:SWIM-type domain-containing protein n=1 Tax=Aphis craccivora TaxID=307492 RepID=A0A6G0Z4J8_APHCR|nr:SWIM-type domain-containing protein [Aphis craccivora]
MNQLQKLYNYSNASVNFKIFEPDLYIVSNKNSWLGYSADGVVIKKCKYISIVKGIYTLKNPHPYYGQIQLGMYLFNLPSTDFCLDCSFYNSMFVITVLMDDKFIFKNLND